MIQAFNRNHHMSMDEVIKTFESYQYHLTIGDDVSGLMGISTMVKYYGIHDNYTSTILIQHNGDYTIERSKSCQKKNF